MLRIDFAIRGAGVGLIGILALCACTAAQAEIQACSGVESTQPSLASLTSAIPPTSVTAAQREQQFGSPNLSATTATATTFWDFVPNSFFVALNAERETVEAMDRRDWIAAIVTWRRFQEILHDPLRRSTQSSIYYEIDWMYALAREATDLSMEDWIESGIGSEIEVDPTLTGARLVSEPLDDDRLWLLVAGLYATHRLHLPALLRPPTAGMLDAVWHRFPDSGSSSQPAERQRLRQYLCNHPATRLTRLDAERREASERVAAEAELNAYVQSALDDFDSMFPLLAPGSARNGMLDLIPQETVRLAVREAMDSSGPAKSYVLLKQTFYDTIERNGELARPQTVWQSLPGFARYLWPDPCLTAAVYPNRTSPLFGAPWVLDTPCRSTAQDREAVRQSVQELQP